ncbi:MAG: response regulator transcription factor [Chloroflexota bacterium]
MASSSEKSGIWFSRMANSPYGKLRAPSDKTRLLIVDDHALYRKGLRSMFELEPDIEVVGEASDGLEAIDRVESLHPDVVLMDINMPGMDGMQATRRLADSYPGILIITLTMFKGDEHLREARRAGSSAYVLKDAGSEILLGTIRDVMSGETPLLQGDEKPASGSTAAKDMSTTKLSDRIPSEPPGAGNNMYFSTDVLITSNERAILKLLAAGMTNDQIAHKTGMPETMVRTYLTEVYRKLGLTGREAAAKYAREQGLLEDD